MTQYLSARHGYNWHNSSRPWSRQHLGSCKGSCTHLIQPSSCHCTRHAAQSFCALMGRWLIQHRCMCTPGPTFTMSPSKSLTNWVVAHRIEHHTVLTGHLLHSLLCVVYNLNQLHLLSYTRFMFWAIVQLWAWLWLRQAWSFSEARDESKGCWSHHYKKVPKTSYNCSYLSGAFATSLHLTCCLHHTHSHVEEQAGSDKYDHR